MARSNVVYHFGSLKLDTRARRLLRGSEPVSLTPKCFELLQVLVENCDRALSKSELIAALWPDADVEEGNLAFQISNLRKALGPEAAKWIETVPRHGYRFNPPPPNSGPNAEAIKRVSAPRRLYLLLLAAIIVVVVAVLIVVILSAREAHKSAFMQPVPLTSFVGDELAPSCSPDGKDRSSRCGLEMVPPGALRTSQL